MMPIYNMKINNLTLVWNITNTKKQNCINNQTNDLVNQSKNTPYLDKILEIFTPPNTPYHEYILNRVLQRYHIIHAMIMDIWTDVCTWTNMHIAPDTHKYVQN